MKTTMSLIRSIASTVLLHNSLNGNTSVPPENPHCLVLIIVYYSCPSRSNQVIAVTFCLCFVARVNDKDWHAVKVLILLIYMLAMQKFNIPSNNIIKFFNSLNTVSSRNNFLLLLPPVLCKLNIILLAGNYTYLVTKISGYV